MESRQADMGRETIARKLKNHKIDIDEGIMDQIVRKMGFKRLSDFYQNVADGVIDIADVLKRYQAMLNPESENNEPVRSAGDFTFSAKEQSGSGDVLIIERNLKGVDYKLAKCCSPIFGDDVFGFVTINGGISIHRKDCSNARQLQERYPYRVIEARWSDIDNTGALYPVTLRIVGNDNIGVVTNITSVISQEKDVIMRGINIESHDTLFSGTLTLLVGGNTKLNKLIAKIEGVKGVKQVKRN
jgi:GTP pyrophosphokinase